jgi:DNA-binding MarR family transcriptional regulator
MRTILVFAFVVTAISLLGVACADPTASDTLTSATDQVGGLVGGVTGTLPSGVAPEQPHKGPDLGKALDAVGQFFAKVAGAIGGAAGAVADVVSTGAVATARFVGDVAVASAKGLADGVAAVSDGLVAAARGLGQGTGSVLQVAGEGVAKATVAVVDATVFVGRALGDAAGWVAAQVGTVVGLYASLVAGLRPSKMPEPAFAAVVATGAAATTAAAGVGLFELVRRFGMVAGLPAVTGFSRIEDDEILKHPLRAQVFSTIQANPGIHASELARRLGVGWGTIVHHLDRLEKGELVAIRKVNNQKCFFEMGGKVSRLDMAVAGAVRGDSASQIAAFVQSHPMTSQKAMAEQLAISPALASFHVKKLVGMGVLEKARRGKETLLSTTESLRRVLAGESGAVPNPPVLVAPMLTA